VTFQCKYEFRKQDGVWQRRLVGRGNSWTTLYLEPEVRKTRNGRQEQETMVKRWVWR
jgi:hypothetical protein